MGYVPINDYKTYSYKIQANELLEPLSFKTFLHETLGFSTRQIRDFKKSKTLLVNSHTMSLDAYLRIGDVITAEFIEDKHYIYPEDIKVDICYEDSDIICINKQSNIVAHPTKGHPSSTLSNAIRFYALAKEEDYKPRLINRLDRDTTGVMIFGKNPHAQHYISEQMQKNEVEKKYIAIVEGHIKQKEGTIDNFINKDMDGIKRIVVKNSNSAKRCITHYKVLQEIREFSVVELLLETGRTHQIRVHMSHIGHPIVGDVLYGANQNIIENFKITRQFLHAYKTKFKPPRANLVEVVAEIPNDMKDFLKI